MPDKKLVTDSNNLKRNIVPLSDETGLKGLYKAAGAAAIVSVIVIILEAAITFLPGGNISPQTVVGWFELLQDNWFIGMRNLGLLNLIFIPLGVPTYLALYAAHKHTNKRYAALLAMIISFIGITVFLATNRALPMIELSRQYALAATDVQRSTLESAGLSMLSVGQSHVPGTFIGFFLGEAAGIIISVVMLKKRVFSRLSAIIGITGFLFMMINEFLMTFIPGMVNMMIFAIGGGLLIVIWYIMLSIRFFQFTRSPVHAE
jgi:hypothetical protein